MGLKEGGIMLKEALRVSWNQTKMGLKVVDSSLHLDENIKLKSDQNGIESTSTLKIDLKKD